MTSTLSQGHSYVKNKIDLDEIQWVATTCWFVEAHAKFVFREWYSRERTLFTWFIQYPFKCDLHQDIWKLIFLVKLGMLDMAKLYSMIPVWMALTFLKVTGCVWKLLEVTQMFVMVDYVGEMTVKKCCKYGGYELF